MLCALLAKSVTHTVTVLKMTLVAVAPKQCVDPYCGGNNQFQRPLPLTLYVFSYMQPSDSRDHTDRNRRVQDGTGVYAGARCGYRRDWMHRSQLNSPKIHQGTIDIFPIVTPAFFESSSTRQPMEDIVEPMSIRSQLEPRRNLFLSRRLELIFGSQLDSTNPSTLFAKTLIHLLN